MNDNDEEERLLRSVTLQNAKSIFLARRRAEEELAHTREALERKTQELAQSLAMMQATLESTTDGILATDGTGKVTGFNDNFATMWRLPSEILEFREHGRILDVTSSYFPDPERFVARINEIYHSSPPESYDLLEPVDGRVFERFSRIQFVNGKNVGRVWSFRDITERRRAEQTLQEQSERLRVTLGSIGDAVVTTDTEAKVVSLNGVAQALTGWTQNEAQGRPLLEVFRIINEQNRQPIVNPAERVLAEGRIFSLANDMLLIARDGTETPIYDSAAPIRDDKGALVGVVLVFRNISDRKKAEEALRKSEGDLAD
ncbi:MAG: PAS domain S-box protein, partial [Acidobacteriota bacterium]